MTGSDTERKSNSSLFHHAMMMMMNDKLLDGISENTARTRNTVLESCSIQVYLTQTTEM